jgi:uncharacterized damage-inducible protein DinB
MAQLAKLIDHCLWANEKWIRFIAEDCPTDEYLLTRLSHILLGEEAWFDRIRDKEPNRNIWAAIPLSSISEKLSQNRDLYKKLLEENLERVIRYKRFTGEEYESPVSDILLHLTLHGTQHRGQMATYVSSKGMKPINTDFIQYCLLNRL